MGKNHDCEPELYSDFELDSPSSDNSSKLDLDMSLSDMERWKEIFETGFCNENGSHLSLCVYYASHPLLL